MWTAQELRNFENYIKVTPKHLLGKAPVRGAYDSVRGGRDHGVSGRLNRSHFSRGGAFALDENERGSGGNVMAAMTHLASKLSPADWAQLREILCGGAAAEDDEPDEVPGRPKGSEAMDRLPAGLRRRVLTAAADQRRAASVSFNALFPEANTVTSVSGASPRALF